VTHLHWYPPKSNSWLRLCFLGPHWHTCIHKQRVCRCAKPSDDNVIYILSAPVIHVLRLAHVSVWTGKKLFFIFALLLRARVADVTLRKVAVARLIYNRKHSQAMTATFVSGNVHSNNVLLVTLPRLYM